VPPITRSELREWLDQDLKQYIREDAFPAAAGKWRWWHRLNFPVIHWQRILRRTEYVVATKHGPWGALQIIFWKWRFLRLSMRVNLEIPLNVFGPGLTVVHYGSIVVNSKVRAGKNCRIHPGVCIGELHDMNPVIGDDVYVGNGAMVIGGISVGNRVKIGPHALIRDSVPDDALMVAEVGKPPQHARGRAGSREVAVF
jgi:serine O-acetyltransferase